jgi:hypothetical protein
VNLGEFLTIKNSSDLVAENPGLSHDSAFHISQTLEKKFGKRPLQIKNLTMNEKIVLVDFFSTEGGNTVFESDFFKAVPKVKIISVSILAVKSGISIPVQKSDLFSIMDYEKIIEKRSMKTYSDVFNYFASRGIDDDKGAIYTIDNIFEIDNIPFISFYTDDNALKFIPAEYCVVNEH